MGDTDNVPEVEPDYRFTLANERTFLAWQRTALGLLAAAVAVVQLVPELSIAGARHVLGIILGLLAILTAGMGILRWQQVDRAMRRDLPLPRHPTPIYLGIGLVWSGCSRWASSSSRQWLVDEHRADEPGWARNTTGTNHIGVDSNLAGSAGQRRHPIAPGHPAIQRTSLAAAGAAAVLALSTYLIGVRRQRLLARRPLPDRISPRREVYLTGVSIVASILISALALTV